MKTLKKDGINEKLLLETLAYIETHPGDWDQTKWRCETGMCFAGHAAITIAGSRPLAPLTRELAGIIKRQNDGEAITSEEREKVNDWEATQAYLRPDPAIDAPLTIDKVEYRNRNWKAVSISDRARELLGMNAVSRPSYGLFQSKNKLPGIRKHVMIVLGINEEDLGIRLRKIAKRNRWEFPPRSKWSS